MNHTVFDSRGTSITLGSSLGRGGEGEIFQIIGNDTSVAKLFHRTPDSLKVSKLQAMIASSDEDLLKFTAWPMDLLLDQPHGKFIGIILPRIDGFKQIHNLYGPSTRHMHFPDANWAFLVHTAWKLSKVVHIIHRRGHIIGDINERNILVSNRGTVRMIDCDSFQISRDGQTYRCGVGVETYTPPELQGTSLQSVDRTVSHDAFGLAVLIFHLLFMGRHPFSGVFTGAGDMTIGRAIREFRFAYGPDAAQHQMKPPPSTLPFHTLPPTTQVLFHRAFRRTSVADGSRPGAREWVEELDGLRNSLTRCATSDSHRFYDRLRTCPWCQLEQSSGHQLFRFVARVQSSVGSGFAIADVWSRIMTVSPPDQPPARPSPSTAVFQTSAWVDAPIPPLPKEAWDRSVDNARQLGIGVVLGGLGLYGIVVYNVVDAPLSAREILIAIGALAFTMLVTLLIAQQIYRSAPARTQAQWVASDHKKRIDRATVELTAAKAKLATVEAKLQQTKHIRQFQSIMNELTIAKKNYDDLPSLRHRKVIEATRRLKGTRFREHLERATIYNASIEGIGVERRAMLQSFGIDSAADVTYQSVIAIPGFGPTLAGRVVAWRQEVERRFTFDPSRGLSTAETQAIDDEIACTRTDLERKLRDGLVRLRNTTDAAQMERASLLAEYREAVDNLAQAELDFRSVSQKK